MNRRGKIIVSITGIFIVLLALVGLTYAYFLTRIRGNEEPKSISVTTGLLELEFSNGTNEVNVTNIEPISSSEVLTKGLAKNFIINKTDRSLDVYTKIKLINLNVSENLAEYDFKWALYQDTTPISTGDFGGKTTGEIVLATNQIINSTTGLEYKLYIWINETGLNQSDMMGGSLTAELDITGTDKKEKTLASLLLGENNINVTTTAPTFNYSSKDRGLFVQSGDATKSEMGFPTYYFKGSATNTNENYNPDYVMNNYVKFGTYQTADGENTVGNDIVWRIVRINEDGTIRLISQNYIASSTVWNSKGVPYYINEDGTDSEIKNVLETWYNNNLANKSTLDTRIVTSSFCNDISGSENRINFSTVNPQFICPIGSIIAHEKIGTLTVDEIAYSGGVFDNSNSKNATYLDNNGFWTLTLYRNTYVSAWINSMMGILAPSVTSTSAVRAVINLSPDVIVSGGDGLSAETAYVVE